MNQLAQSCDLAGRDVQCGEQRGRAVADVDMRLTLGDRDLHRQGWRCAIQCLDLGLLIDAERDRVLGRSR